MSLVVNWFRFVLLMRMVLVVCRCCMVVVLCIVWCVKVG